MIKTLKFASLCCALMMFAGCGNDAFITDGAYRRQVSEDFEIRQKMLSGCDALSIFDEPSLTSRERGALEFLYAYMPLGDALNLDGEFFLKNVRLSEQARQEMTWGASIPEDIYRHFVLPMRVNNENLDNAREVFYNELRDRVAGLSMTDAILEINHWCHEKVTYTPSDARTSAPLALVQTASGRCGEESTFLVTALRAVGIPARQVYTPRWAHTDDNHAWVEAWADGEWHFLGACEPEPVLDLGWFNAPASRAMLLHTNVFGRYAGKEDVIQKNDLVTEINITENYTPTAKMDVHIVNADGTPAADAFVEYKIYNYAEFYTVASQKADGNGHSSISAGCGDALVWASKDGKYGFAKVSFGKDKDVTVALKYGGEPLRTEFHIVPPAENAKMPPVTEEQRAENTRRMEIEDSIRNAHTATFATRENTAAFAKKHGLDERRTTRALTEAKGNRAVVEEFLAAAASKGEGNRALDLLGVVSAKDLHDTPLEVFNDHLYNSKGDARRVMNPRVGIELLTPYRSQFQGLIDEKTAEVWRNDPQQLVEWCRENLTLEPNHNLRLVPIRPLGVWKSHIADLTSRDIFFVAVCRSLEIPAWRDYVTGKVRYEHNGKEFDVDFETPEPVANDYGVLKLSYTPSKTVATPRYYNHFTVSRIVDGKLQLLNFNDDALIDEFAGEGVRLEAGEYLLVGGTRLGGGDVLTEMTVFTIPKDETVTVELRLPEEQHDGKVLGMFDMNVHYTDMEGVDKLLQDAVAGDAVVVGILGAGEEPTNHALHDMAAFRETLDGLNTPLVMLFESEANAARFSADNFPALPEAIQLGIDNSGEVRKRLVEGVEGLSNSLPIIAVCDAFGRVTFVSSGYSIGLGERLVKELSR